MQCKSFESCAQFLSWACMLRTGDPHALPSPPGCKKAASKDVAPLALLAAVILSVVSGSFNPFVYFQF